MSEGGDPVQIQITPEAVRFICAYGGQVMVRSSPRHGCCGGTVLLPVIDLGGPREPQSYRQVHRDGVVLHIDESLTDDLAVLGGLTIGVDGFWRWRKLWLEGLDAKLATGRSERLRQDSKRLESSPGVEAMTYTMEHRPIRVMFLCTGNSCRSQMAEGFARAIGGEAVEAYSAGLEPHGLNPKAVAVMRETGIDISQQTSDEIDMDLLERMDYAITLCGNAEGRCPMTPSNVQRLHWPLDDPAKATGSPEEVMNAFRRVRDQIRVKLEAFMDELRGEEERHV